MFDPWTASYEDVLEAQKSFNGESYCDPIYQWSDAARIKQYELKKDEISGFDVLACIRKCVCRELVVPHWLSIEFIKRYDAVLSCTAKSWDDPKAFGRPYLKGSNINAMRKKRELCFGVLNDVNNLYQSGDYPLDDHLFELVGKKYNIGKTLASEYYYYAKTLIPKIPK